MFLIRAERTVAKITRGFLVPSLTPIKPEEDDERLFSYSNCRCACFQHHIDLYGALEESRHLSCLCQSPHKVSLDVFLATSSLRAC